MKKILINKYFLFTFCALAVCLLFISIYSTPESSIASNQTLDYDVNFISSNNNSRKLGGAVDQNPIKLEATDNQPHDIDESINDENPDDSKNLTNYLRHFSSELMMAMDLQEKFDADETDAAIATESEKELAYIFYQGMEWQEFSPQEISCKKNICRTELTILSLEKKSQLMELISDQMMVNNINFIYAIPASLPVEGKEIIYFIRKNSLPTSPGVLP